MAQREWAHAGLPGVAGSQVFDTETNWRLIADCVRQVLTQSGVDASAIRALSRPAAMNGTPNSRRYSQTSRPVYPEAP